MRKKISLIGAGNVGGELASLIVSRELGDVVLVDIAEGLPQGKSLDIMHSKPLVGSDAKIYGSSQFSDTEGSFLYIVSAGSARKPGMSRDDLLKINAGVISQIADNIKKYSPQSFVIVITNPLDAMAYLMYKKLKFPKNKVIGMAGVLDSARFRAFLSEELNISVCDISATVLGGHGDSMVPLLDYCTVAGVPITQFMEKEKLEKIAQRVRKAGGEIVSYLKTGSAFVSPAYSAYEMVEAILKDKKRVLPCCAYLEGEYGVKDLYVGVMAVLGKDGVEKIIEPDLSPQEKTSFLESVATCKKNIEKLKELNFL